VRRQIPGGPSPSTGSLPGESPGLDASASTTLEPHTTLTATPTQENSSTPTGSSSTVAEVESAGDAIIKAELQGLNPELELFTTPERGRGLRLKADTQAYSPGKEILSAAPFASSLSSSCLDAYCHTCFRALFETRQSWDDGPPAKKLRCSSCKTIHYCSPACQKEDWPAHKLECKALRAYAESAAFATSQESHAGSREDRLSDVTKSLAQLQTGDGSSEERRARTVPEMSVRLAARLVWLRKAKGEEWWAVVDALCAHRHKDVTPYERQLGSSVVELVHFLICSTVQLSDLPSTDSGAFLRTLGFDSIRPLLKIIAAIQNNGVTLTTPDLTPIGISLQTHIALANHSCLPNSVIVCAPRRAAANNSASRAGGIMRIVALKLIDPGAEILVSYCDLSDPREVRQHTLNESYHFECACTACSRARKAGQASAKGKAHTADPREAMWCAKRCGATLPIPTSDSGTLPDKVRIPCKSCGAVLEVAPASIRDQVQKGKLVLEMVLKQTPEAAWIQLREILPTLLRLFPSSSYPLHALLNEALHTLISLSHSASTSQKDDESRAAFEFACLDEAARAALLVVASVQAGNGYCFAPGNPFRANVIATAGMVLVDCAHAAERAASPPHEACKPTLGTTSVDEGEDTAEDECKIAICNLKDRNDFQPALREFTTAFRPLAPFRTPSEEYKAKQQYASQCVTVGTQLLQQAHAELLIAFGKRDGGGQVGKAVSQRLHEVLAEVELAAKSMEQLTGATSR